MNAEQQIFLSLLKGHVQGTADTAVPGTADWERIYSYAEEQSLLGVCYCQLKELPGEANIPAEVLERFHKGFFNDIYMAVNQQVHRDEIETLFQSDAVPYMLFKGCVVKDSWPVPVLRTMGDIDILVYPGARMQTDAIMKQLDYRRMIDNHAVWTYYKKDVIVELHDHMFYEHLANDVDYQSYFDQVWKHSDSDHLKDMHLLYMIAHMAKHTVNKGIGFRAFMDLVFFCRSEGTSLDWDWIRSELSKLKLLEYAKKCFALCQRWFETEPPIPGGALDDQFFTFVTDKVFRDGTFGIGNEQNEASVSAKEISHHRGPYKLGAVKVTLHRIFPPYRDMQLIPWYSFVDGKPWLLPAAWAYRWFYCIFHKRKQGQELIAEPFRKKEIIENRQRLLREWGLL